MKNPSVILDQPCRVLSAEYFQWRRKQTQTRSGSSYLKLHDVFDVATATPAETPDSIWTSAAGSSEMFERDVSKETRGRRAAATVITSCVASWRKQSSAARTVRVFQSTRDRRRRHARILGFICGNTDLHAANTWKGITALYLWLLMLLQCSENTNLPQGSCSSLLSSFYFNIWLVKSAASQ